MKFRFLVNTQTDKKGRRIGVFGYEHGHELTLAYSWEIPSCFEPEHFNRTIDQDRVYCEALFEIFNIRHPKEYQGPSMSVGDVVELSDENGSRAYAVTPVGFSNELGGIKGEVKPTPKEWWRRK